MEDSAISRAVHAETEAARAEIRAAGIVCPSCCVNAADLPEGHMLELGTDGGDAKCADGSPVSFDSAPFAVFEAAFSVNMFDQMRAAESQLWALVPGDREQPGKQAP
jgi:hypothetical protein